MASGLASVGLSLDPERKSMAPRLHNKFVFGIWKNANYNNFIIVCSYNFRIPFLLFKLLIVSPEGKCESSAQEGPLDSLSILICD